MDRFVWSVGLNVVYLLLGLSAFRLRSVPAIAVSCFRWVNRSLTHRISAGRAMRVRRKGRTTTADRTDRTRVSLNQAATRAGTALHSAHDS